jgi:peptidoglycan/xylan/chitin deacetylase (PgdA/CDA1 family)
MVFGVEMTNTGMNVAEENRRRRRVNKIKKIIICMVIVCIAIPTALSGLLAVKVVMLENEIKQLKAASSKNVSATNENVAGSTVNDKVIKQEEAQLYEINDVDAAADSAEITKDEEDIKKVYLTFDDGPSDNTDQILDILAQYNVKATFFVIANHDEDAGKWYNRIVNEGHTLGMHSYTHVYSQIYENIDSYMNDVNSLRDFLTQETGYTPTIYRFPGGSSNTVMNFDIQECISFLSDNGITYFDWNVSAGDATGNGYPASTLAENVLEGVAKHDNAVVLLHDTNSKDATVAALPIILDALTAMDDVVILPLTEDSYPVQHTKKQ